ncbi:hypothetical protein D3C80_1259080 [compost metagenome]
MPEKTHPPQVMTIEPMIIPPAAQRRTRHIQIDHLLGTTGNRCHRKPTGIGKQIQHPLARRLLPHPAPPVAHIEKQPGVLLQTKIQLIAQTVFINQPVLTR